MKPSLFRLLILLVIVLAGTSRIAQAAAYTVTTLTDSASGTCTASACTISQALAAANDSNQDDLIEFAADLRGEIAIAATLVVANSTDGGGRLTVRGRLGSDAQPEILLSGSNVRSVMDINTLANVSIESLGIVKGYTNSYGGGIRNRGTANIVQSTFANNRASTGGGIGNLGVLTIARSTLTNNVADIGGGGIYNRGTLTITHSRLSANQSNQGAGINNQSAGVLTLTHSTLSDNSAGSTATLTGSGGGILNMGTLNIAQSTLQGNTSTGGGGGIYNSNAGATLNLAHSTLTGNSASTSGGGIRNSRGIVTITASVLAGSLSDGDCFTINGTTHASHSLIQDSVGCVNGSDTANLTGNPLLGPLQDNGGATFTHLPRPDSPLIDAVACDLLPGFDNRTDQRDITRPQGARCDIGAVERVPTPPRDVAIRKTLTQSLVLMDGTGDGVFFEILVQNLGDDPILQAHVQDLLPDSFAVAFWRCKGLDGGTCPYAVGGGDIDQHVDLPVGGSVLYTLLSQAFPVPDEGVVNTAAVDVEDDLDLDNNTDSARYQRCGTANFQTDPDDFTLLPYPSTCIFLDGFDIP